MAKFRIFIQRVAWSKWLYENIPSDSAGFFENIFLIIRFFRRGVHPDVAISSWGSFRTCLIVIEAFLRLLFLMRGKRHDNWLICWRLWKWKKFPLRKIMSICSPENQGWYPKNRFLHRVSTEKLFSGLAFGSTRKLAFRFRLDAETYFWSDVTKSDLWVFEDFLKICIMRVKKGSNI